MKFSSNEQVAFVKNVESAYASMRTVYGRVKQVENIRRYRSRCASGCFEDLFAGFIYDHLPKGRFFVFIDCPIAVANDKKQCVDFVLCRKRREGQMEIIYLAELKTCSSYFKDEVVEVCNDIVNNRKVLQRSKLTGDSGGTMFACAPQVKYDVIIYSAVGNSPSVLQAAQERVNSNGDEQTKLLILCDPCKDEFIRQVPRSTEFGLLAKRISGAVCC